MKTPSSDELVRRVDALEAAITQMLNALKADLAALRADLILLKANEAPRVGSGSFSAQPTRKASTPSHSISEQTARPTKKDPRSDE